MFLFANTPTKSDGITASSPKGSSSSISSSTSFEPVKEEDQKIKESVESESANTDNYNNNNNNKQNDNGNDKELILKSIDEALHTKFTNFEAQLETTINSCIKNNMTLQTSLLTSTIESKKEESSNFLYDIISTTFGFLINIYKSLGYIPFIGGVLQFLVLLNIFSFLVAHSPPQISSLIYQIVHFILSKLIPAFFAPLVYVFRNVTSHADFSELRDAIGE